MANFAKIEPRMIVVYPRGQLRAPDRKTLKDAGVIAIEADDPSEVVAVIPMAPASLPTNSDDMSMALLHAVAIGNEGQKFAAELYRRAKEREASKSAAATKPSGELPDA